MELGTAIAVAGVAVAILGLALLHVFSGPKDGAALLRKELDDLRRETDHIRVAHYALAERVARDYHDKAEVRDIVTQIHSRITEILRRLESRNGQSG